MCVEPDCPVWSDKTTFSVWIAVFELDPRASLAEERAPEAWDSDFPVRVADDALDEAWDETAEPDLPTVAEEEPSEVDWLEDWEVLFSACLDDEAFSALLFVLFESEVSSFSDDELVSALSSAASDSDSSDSSEVEEDLTTDVLLEVSAPDF